MVSTSLPETMVSPRKPVGARATLDLDLIRKYSVAGPRYTSYPPATRFREDLPREAYDKAIADDNRDSTQPLSLYFHLPFCETLCWYCGCNTVVTRSPTAAKDYLVDLAREVELLASRVDRRRPVTQIHLGGGTPTFFPPQELAELGLIIHKHFKVAEDCEFGVEIDPRRLTKDHVDALKVIGANRASLGIQDTDPKVQIAIHRWQPFRLSRQAVDWVREAGFTSVNFDLIYGLPLQTVSSFERTIDEVFQLGPDRLSVFSYAHVPWVRPAQRIFDKRNELPQPEDKLAMFALAHEKLTQAGYVDIGLDHFARPDDELAVAQQTGKLQRNFQGYSTSAGASLYGFGVSSISSTDDSYRQNMKDLDTWRAALAEGRLPTERGLILDEEDKRRRALVMGVMCDRRLDYAELSGRLGVDVAARYKAEIDGLADLEADGLLVRKPDGIEVQPVGIPLLRVIAMRFDATLAKGEGRHSKII
jgi:oxygen-independent coproporphyrinogen III oxidase